MRESSVEAWSSKPERRAEHLVSRGSTAAHKYLLRAKAMSVDPKPAYDEKGDYIYTESNSLC